MTEPGRTTPEQRRLMRQIAWWLRGDLFERVPNADVPDDVNPETTAVWRSPLGWTVILGPREDGTGWAGEVRNPAGEWVSTTSWVDVNWLDEKLP